MTSFRSRCSGHWWTMRAGLQRWSTRLQLDDHPWSVPLHDEARPDLTLRGRIHRGAARDTAVVLVHGLGGDADSPYLRVAAAECARRGWDVLRVSLRGADRSGEDFYHAGLSDDLVPAIRTFAGFRRVFLIGYSLGGHLALHYATRPDAEIHGVVAIGAPLDLQRSALAFDRPSATLYREVVLASLKRAYRAYAARHPEVAPYRTIAPVRTIRGWDRAVVVPRFGFGSTARYYAAMSVAPRLSHLRIPALYIGAQGDPMVPRWTVEPHLAAASTMEVHLLPRGGHVAFPGRLVLQGRPGALEGHVFDWLDRRLV